jgi:hypothetical protein
MRIESIDGVSINEMAAVHAAEFEFCAVPLIELLTGVPS